MNKLYAIKALFLMFFMILCGMRSYGCTCPGSAEYSMGEFSMEWHNSFEYVFIGLVENAKDSNRHVQKALIKNMETIKGKVPAFLYIELAWQGSSCGYDLKKYVGNSLVIYGYKDQKGNITTHFCAGTTRFYTRNEIDTIITGYTKRLANQQYEFISSVAETKNGAVATTYSNGQRTSEGALENGFPVGKWTYYSYFGLVTSEGGYTTYKKEGIWTEYSYHSDGNILLSYKKGRYSAGEKTGEWITFEPNGDYRYTEYFDEQRHFEKNTQSIRQTKEY